jgi:ElaB/YqjD/DUF883 family membrane-anchored ribosome-binding protein
MSDEPQAAVGQTHDNGTSKSALGRAWDFMTDHPKTTMIVGAGVSMVAGAELLAAALVGGALTLVFAPRSR